jgi:putative ABC transport system ATP-binding protein
MFGSPPLIPLIETVALERSSNDQPARLLEPTDFRLQDGDRVSLTGPSGSGKSVFLRLIALLDRADQGTVSWRGSVVEPATIPAFRRRVAYLPQRAAMFDGTVEQNLRYPFSLAAYRGMRFDLDVVTRLAAHTGRTTKFLNRNVMDLSGGESQIVALMRVLQLSPEVLLLDEPTASLDPNSALEVELLVSNWFAQRNSEFEKPTARASIWVSHDPAQATRTGSRHLTMQQGRLSEGLAS